jgi:hypothetical protein
MASKDLRSFVAHELRRHPRVEFQELLGDASAGESLAGALPPLTPFARPGVRGKPSFYGAIAILDWDHRLPSSALILRIYGYHTKASLAAGEEAYEDRLELIAARDRYPEFDLPDFANLVADEAYQIDLDTEGVIGDCKLTSAWRRDIAREDASVAEAAVRNSPEFHAVQEAATRRPPQLGGAEAVSWMPPCESGHSRWTIDVWYLLSFDGRIATGQSFLVDLEGPEVVSSREISVRAG